MTAPPDPPAFDVRIVHEDADLLVVDKPSGLVVHKGWARDGGGIVALVRAQLGCPVWPVHRLDRGTSGVLVFAKTKASASTWGAAFQEGQVGKAYVALVRGHPPDDMLIENPVPSKPDGPRVAARTRVMRLGAWERYGLVLALPQTGRLHQIRRHLKHISCPLIGDVNYGKGEHNRLFRDRFGFHRLALHALALQRRERNEEHSERLPQSPLFFAALTGAFEELLVRLELQRRVPSRDQITALLSEV